jgi:hypothetical protein
MDARDATTNVPHARYQNLWIAGDGVNRFSKNVFVDNHRAPLIAKVVIACGSEINHDRHDAREELSSNLRRRRGVHGSGITSASRARVCD